MRRALLLLALVLAGCAAPDPYARAPDGHDQQAVTIPRQQFLHPTFGAKGPVHARVTFHASAPIDAWLVAQADCTKYGARDFPVAAAALAQKDATLEADLPAGVADCLVLDNTDYAAGHAPAGDAVNVTYTLDVWFRKG